MARQEGTTPLSPVQLRSSDCTTSCGVTQLPSLSSVSEMVALLRRFSLSHWIVVAMLAGVLFGWQFPAAAARVGIVSDLFIRLIKCIIVPLLFATLVVGIAGHTDDLKAVGRLALKSFIYFEVVTTVALAIGLLAVNIVKPGVGINLPESAGEAEAFKGKAKNLPEMLLHAAPTSFFDAA